jgi:hypothetical protein
MSWINDLGLGIVVAVQLDIWVCEKLKKQCILLIMKMTVWI